MDDDSGDEDVVFEGSALHQHLLDTGYTDFEPSHLSYSSALHDNFTRNSSKDAKIFLSPLREKWGLLSSATTGEWLRESLVRSGVRRVVGEAGLISEDDWLLLDHFLPEGAMEHHSGHPWYHFIWSLPLQIIPVNSMWLIIMSLLMLGVGISSTLFEVWYSSISALLLVLPSFFFLQQGYVLLSSCHLVLQVKKVVIHLRDFSQIVSKSLRLLQEMDLIAKGFVLAQGSGSTKFSVEHETPQGSSLRDALTTALKAVTPILFVNHHFLDQFTHLYPCMRHLFDDMPNIPESCNSTEHLLFLKKWVAVLKIQLSTLMTELLLSVHHPLGVHQLYVSDSKVFSVEQASIIDNESKSLVRHYDFTKVFLFEDRESRKAHNSVEDKKKNVFIAVHSLSLHMQAALFRIHNLEKDFESDSYSTSEQDLKQEHVKLPTLEYVREQLDIIKRELESCQGCLEEAEARVDRKYGASKVLSNPEISNSSISDIEEVAPVKSQKSVIVLSALEDPVIEDEVFEAYIDQEYSDRLNDTYDDNFWSADVKKERQMMKQQKEQGKRVLKELQPILVNRRKMWEKREEIALTKHLVKESQVHDKECSFDGENSLKQQQNNVGDETVRSTTDSADKHELVLEDQVAEDKIISVASIRNTAPYSEFYEKQNCDCAEDEVDSDEERLEVYRKLRKELDDDEKRRLVEEEQESVFKVSLQDLKPHQNMMKTKNDVANDAPLYVEGFPCQAFSKEHLLSGVTSCKDSVYSDSVLDARENITQKYNVDSKLNPNQSFNVVKCSNLTDTVPMTKATVAETSFSDSENDLANIEECEDKPALTKEDEIYEDGDDSADLEYVQFSLPPHPTNTLAERLQLYSGGCGVGFHAEVAAQAIAASRLFRQVASSSVEVFDGVGEGEEYSTGDDDDDIGDKEEQS